MHDTDGDYEAKQCARDRSAQSDYDVWWASLSPAERAEHRRHGLEAGPVVTYVGNHELHSIEDRYDIGTPEDVTDSIDTPAEVMAEELDLTPSQAAAVIAWHAMVNAEEVRTGVARGLARVIGELAQPGPMRLKLYSLAFAADMHPIFGHGGKVLRTYEDAAAEVAVTKQAFSKWVNKWRDDLGLHPTPGAKSAAAKEAYRKAQRENHWRRKGKRKV